MYLNVLKFYQKYMYCMLYIERNSIDRDILTKKIFKHIYKYKNHRSHVLHHYVSLKAKY